MLDFSQIGRFEFSLGSSKLRVRNQLVTSVVVCRALKGLGSRSWMSWTHLRHQSLLSDLSSVAKFVSVVWVYLFGYGFLVPDSSVVNQTNESFRAVSHWTEQISPIRIT